jgi:transcription initiation factor IIE alpha subunit
MENKNYSLQDVLDYLKHPRTRQEIAIQFSMSNTSSYRLIRWMTKRNLIECSKNRQDNHQNHVWKYFVIED